MNPVDPGQGVEGWLDRAIADLSTDPDFVAESLALDIAEQIVRIMEMENVSRSELAETLGVNRAYITKVLNAPPNLTLRSIAAVAIALKKKPRVSLIGAIPSGERTQLNGEARYRLTAAGEPPWSATQPQNTTVEDSAVIQFPASGQVQVPAQRETVLAGVGQSA